MWHIHTTEYYSAKEREEIPTHAPTWMNPGNVLLSEISQAQKDKYHMVPLI